MQISAYEPTRSQSQASPTPLRQANLGFAQRGDHRLLSRCVPGPVCSWDGLFLGWFVPGCEKGLSDEAASVSRLGMTCIHIPVDFQNRTIGILINSVPSWSS